MRSTSFKLALAGEHGRSIVTFYTTANTIIGADVLAYANKLSVTIKQSVAFENKTTGNLHFTPPITLTYGARRKTIKLPVGLPSFKSGTGTPLKF